MMKHDKQNVVFVASTLKEQKAPIEKRTSIVIGQDCLGTK